MNRTIISTCSAAALLASAAVALAAPATAPAWTNPALSPDQRAVLLDHELTMDERIALLHGPMAMPIFGIKTPPGAVGSAGYIPGLARLGIPALQESDASLGVTNPLDVRKGDGSTALPSGLSLGASFNPAIAYAGGAMAGSETHAKGMNVLLAGGVNLTRDPRNGRNFEYVSEDPLLSGTLVGEAVRGIQDQHVVSTVKHFALNGQETNRHWANSVIDEAALRESDLLAFEIAIEKGKPGSVMCAYNLVNGDYSCGNDFLLNRVLKGDWSYKGWVMSDWGAVHGVDYAAKGLDQQSGEQLDGTIWFGAPLKALMAKGAIKASKISDMSQRILRSEFAAGLFEDPAKPVEIDYKAHGQVSRTAAQEGIVLLKNEGGVLPLVRTAKTIAVIGGYANFGVLSGGGSSQVLSPNGNYTKIPLGGEGMMGPMRSMILHGSPPLNAIRKAAPNAKVTYDDGRYLASAVAAAKDADVVIMIGIQWSTEGEDMPDLSLPQGQDAVISAVTAANPRTVVVLETGGPVLMPWLDKAAAVLEAWYPGGEGGQAIADVLFGDVDASGRLPLTFPAAQKQYPREDLPGLGLPQGKQFDVVYTEGADVGYRRFAKTGDKPLYPFGYGLSYTSFGYSDLKVTGGSTLTVSFKVTNTGARDGKAAPQLYLKSIAGKPEVRLIGFDKLSLKPGETRTVTLKADPRLLARFDAAKHNWSVAAGEYQVAVGRSSADFVLNGAARINTQTIKP